jgi:hypothetical protein
MNSETLRESQFNDGDVTWDQPMLALYPKRESRNEPGIKRKLFIIPSYFGEEFDPNFAPIPTPQNQLPEIKEWTRQFLIRLIEISATRRSPHQLARWCHRATFQKVLTMTKEFDSLPKLRKIYIREPLESVIEVAATIGYKARVRVITVRFEGLDNRWLCTAIDLL